MRNPQLLFSLILLAAAAGVAADPGERCLRLDSDGRFVERACAAHDLKALETINRNPAKALESPVLFKIFGAGAVPSGVPVSEDDPNMQYAALFDSDPTPNPGCSPFDTAFIVNSGGFGTSGDGAKGTIIYNPGAFVCGLYVQSGCFDYVQSMDDACFGFLSDGRSHMRIQGKPPFSAAFDGIGLGTPFAASIVYADGPNEVASDLCTGLEGISVGLVTRFCTIDDVNLQSPIDPTLEAAVDIARLEFDFGEFQGGPMDVEVDFQVAPNPVEVGQQFTLSWSAPQALTGASCLAGLGSPTPWSTLGAVENVGSISYPAPTAPGTYFFGLTCEGPNDGFGSAGLELEVIPASTPSSLSLDILPAATAPGAVVTLNWAATGIDAAAPCMPGPNWPLAGSLPPQGSVSFAAPNGGPQQYTLSCSSSSGDLQQTVVLDIVAQPPLPMPAPPRLISQNAAGNAGDGPSRGAQVGERGEAVAFLSQATDLSSTTASGEQSYLRDTAAATTTLVSRDIQGNALPFSSAQVALASHSGFVAFATSDGQIRGFDSSTGQASGALSTASGGALGNAASDAVALTDQYTAAAGSAVFASSASNLIAGAPSSQNIYVKNGSSVELISRPGSGLADGPSSAPAVSGDGQTFAFSTDASNLGAAPQPGGLPTQICLAGPAQTGGRPRLCVSENFLTGLPGNAPSTQVQLNADGRFGVFTSDASNLVADDSNGVSDIYWFAWDGRQLTGLVRVSTDANGAQADGASYAPQISADGQTVIFISEAGNLLPGDSNAAADVYIKHVRSGQIGLISGAGGMPAAGAALDADLSPYTRSVVFTSTADNLLSSDGNGHSDVFQVAPALVQDADEPGFNGVPLPTPDPPNSNCPAGYYIATIADGPQPGVHPGIFGLELLLNPPGSRELAGGLNFGGLVDAGQVGFAGVNIANPSGEVQRLDLSVNGVPLQGPSDGSYPVRVLLERPNADGSRSTVLELQGQIGQQQSLTGSVEVAPGYYVASVIALEGEPGGDAEGVFYFGLNTSFVDRLGGGFQGGAVVGGYHADNPLGAPSGFAAFCIADPYTVSARVLSERSYGPSGAADLRLQLLDQQQQPVYRIPSY